jgi:hypothetical protein
MSETKVLYREGAVRYVLSDGSINTEGKPLAQIADTFAGVLYPPAPLRSIMARGAWDAPKPGTSADDVLALVKPI